MVVKVAAPGRSFARRRGVLPARHAGARGAPAGDLEARFSGPTPGTCRPTVRTGRP